MSSTIKIRYHLKLWLREEKEVLDLFLKEKI